MGNDSTYNGEHVHVLVYNRLCMVETSVRLLHTADEFENHLFCSTILQSQRKYLTDGIHHYESDLVYSTAQQVFLMF